MAMTRVTLRIPEQQVKDVDEKVENGEYPSRSEVIRDAVRRYLEENGDGEYHGPLPGRDNRGRR